MDEKAIFITGAAKGIGRATALFFAEKGWLVGAYDIDASDQSLVDLFIATDIDVDRHDSNGVPPLRDALPNN